MIDKDILILLIQNGVAMAVVILGAVLLAIAGIGSAILYFQKKHDNGEFQLEKAKREVQAMEVQANYRQRMALNESSRTVKNPEVMR